MQEEKSLLDIIIPVFNEEKISHLFELLENNVKTPFRVLLCFDSYKDNTLNCYHSEDYSFDIDLVLNKGKGVHSAILTGFDQSKADALLVYPADDLINTQIIDNMYDYFLKGCDVVVASRFIKGGSMRNCPFPKNLLVRLGNFSLFLLSSIPVMDSSNGFRLFSKKLINNVQIESKKGFTYSIELLVKARRLNFVIAELPSQWAERSSGKSNFKLISWLNEYLKWYFYGLATFWLRKGQKSVKQFKKY